MKIAVIVRRAENDTLEDKWSPLSTPVRVLSQSIHFLPQTQNNTKLSYLMLILLFALALLAVQLFIAAQNNPHVGLSCTHQATERKIKIKSQFNLPYTNNRRLPKIFAIDMLYQFYLNNQYSLVLEATQAGRMGFVSSNCWGGFVVFVIFGF